MAEQWEHMIVMTTADGQLASLSSAGLDDESESATPRGLLALINRYGEDGWQLVSVDAADDAYWLKRRLE